MIKKYLFAMMFGAVIGGIMVKNFKDEEIFNLTQQKKKSINKIFDKKTISELSQLPEDIREELVIKTIQCIENIYDTFDEIEVENKIDYLKLLINNYLTHIRYQKYNTENQKTKENENSEYTENKKCNNPISEVIILGTNENENTNIKSDEEDEESEEDTVENIESNNNQADLESDNIEESIVNDESDINSTDEISTTVIEEPIIQEKQEKEETEIKSDDGQKEIASDTGIVDKENPVEKEVKKKKSTVTRRKRATKEIKPETDDVDEKLFSEMVKQIGNPLINKYGLIYQDRILLLLDRLARTTTDSDVFNEYSARLANVAVFMLGGAGEEELVKIMDDFFTYEDKVSPKA